MRRNENIDVKTKSNLNKVTKKDNLFLVLWKLHKISQREINPGETTAYKHFDNASEAKRFKKTLHEFNSLKKQMISANSLEEALRIL